MTGRAYRIQVAAKVSGVKEGLIRAWERRYGVLDPVRTPAGYRTYSDADIEVLKRLKQLTDEGVSIAQAVALLPSIRREVKARTTEKTIKVPRASQLKRWRDDILLAAQRLDQPGIEATLDEALRSTPPVPFYEDLIAPLLREVGERWHKGTLTVAEEHLISFAARERLISLLAGAPRKAAHHVICACPQEDQHELGLIGAALRFRHAGWRVTFLGARTPADHLERAVRALSPDLVALSLVETTGAAEYLNELAARLPEGIHVVIGGQAAHRNAALAEKHGFQLVETDEDWTKLLRRTR
ncbi:MAG: MerR family transcriptional regulator [Archangium sp.]|nr:MerR family transcriptional regulator [Archangium sp.]